MNIDGIKSLQVYHIGQRTIWQKITGKRFVWSVIWVPKRPSAICNRAQKYSGSVKTVDEARAIFRNDEYSWRDNYETVSIPIKYQVLLSEKTP